MDGSVDTDKILREFELLSYYFLVPLLTTVDKLCILR